MINKRDISRPRTANDIEMRYHLSQIDNKVDKTSGMGLSTNNFSNTYKKDVEENTKSRHTHNNLTLLNTLTESMINEWDKATHDSIYSLFSGSSTGDVVLASTDYDFFIIIYGDSSYINSKIVINTTLQFCLDLVKSSETVKEFYTFSGTTIQKKSTTTNITIFKVLAYKKGDVA